jgi:hypothetical protein
MTLVPPYTNDYVCIISTNFSVAVSISRNVNNIFLIELTAQFLVSLEELIVTEVVKELPCL